MKVNEVPKLRNIEQGKSKKAKVKKRERQTPKFLLHIGRWIDELMDCLSALAERIDSL